MEESDEDSSSESSVDEESKKNGGDIADQFVLVEADGKEKNRASMSAEQIKKLKRKTKLAQAAKIAALALESKERQEPKRDKILTFRDMSHLSYFTGGGISDHKQEVVHDS
jgi:hypothetical protein